MRKADDFCCNWRFKGFEILPAINFQLFVCIFAGHSHGGGGGHGHSHGGKKTDENTVHRYLLDKPETGTNHTCGNEYHEDQTSLVVKETNQETTTIVNSDCDGTERQDSNEIVIEFDEKRLCKYQSYPSFNENDGTNLSTAAVMIDLSSADNLCKQFGPRSGLNPN